MSLGVVIAANAQGGQQPSSPVINVGFDVTFDAAYPTGGLAFDPAAQLQALGKYDKAPFIVAVLPQGHISGRRAIYDSAAKKLLVWKADGSAEETNGGNLSTITFRVLVMAR